MTIAGSAPITVVICDDHLVLAEGLAAVLSAEDDIVVVGVAGSVAEVVELVGRHHPDVVMMDYELPDGDGVAATRAVKEAYPEVQVVMLTSFSSRDVLVAALEAGCSGYLTKHAGGQKVAESVRQTVAGEAIISASLLQELLPRLKVTPRAVGDDLTTRELEVLELLADGLSGQAMAARLYVSTNTIRNHVQNVLKKLGVHSRLEAVALAVQAGIIHRS